LVWSRGLKSLLLIDDKADEELAIETEKDAIELVEVTNIIFGLLSHYQKRAEYLTCLESDYESGVFGCGKSENLLNSLLLKEIERLQNLGHPS